MNKGSQMNIKSSAMALGLLLGALTAASGQSPVVTLPHPVSSSLNGSTTIGVTNTFQSVFVASTSTPGRVSCIVQNKGTNAMYVFFGALADATIAKSVKIVAGQAAYCNIGGVVLKQQVSVTGTATEAFYAAQQ